MLRGTAPLAIAAAPALAAARRGRRAGGAALAQELDPDADLEGKILSATISQRFEVNDNYDLDDPSPGTSYFTDTRLNLGFLNATDTQTFRLGLDTGLRALWEAEEDFKFTVASPTSANVGYVNEWASGVFDAALTFRQRRVDYIDSIDDFVTDEGALPDDLDQLQGDTYELRYDADVGVAFATDSPSSYALRFLGTKIDYTEDTPSQVPRTTLEGQADWTLRLTPVFSSIVSADYLTYDADNDRRHLAPGRLARCRRDLRAERGPHRPRRHRLRRPQARGHQRRRRPRDHPERQRPARPRRLPLHARRTS